VDAVSLAEFRFLGVGAVGGPAGGRPVGRGAGGRAPVAAGIVPLAHAGTGHGPQPGAVGLLAVESGGADGGAAAAALALCHLRGGSLAVPPLAGLGRAVRRHRPATDQHVRYHRDHGARDVP